MLSSIFLNGDTLPPERIFEYFSGWMGDYLTGIIWFTYFPPIFLQKLAPELFKDAAGMTVLHSMPRECRWNAFGMPIECRGNADECRHQNARNASGMPRDSRECRECRGTGGNAVGNAAGMPQHSRECRGNAGTQMPGMPRECRVSAFLRHSRECCGNAAGMPCQ